MSRARWVIVIGALALVAVALAVTGLAVQQLFQEAAALEQSLLEISDTEKRVSIGAALLQGRTDGLVKIVTGFVQFLGLLAVGIGAAVGWRNLRLAQATLEATQKRLDVDLESQITNRFTQAIGQLGAELKDGEPNLEIRLGGIYALERIAQDSPSRDYWAIMEILTAYVRQNAPAPDPVPDSGEQIAKGPPPRVDVQAVLTVLGRRSAKPSEPGRLNLTGTDLLKANLSRGNFKNADFSGARLSMARLSDAEFQGAVFHFADLQLAACDRAQFESADFWGARMESGRFRDSHLESASLRAASIMYADFHGAHLEGADFWSAEMDFAMLAESKGLAPKQLEWAEQAGGSASLPASWGTDWRERLREGWNGPHEPPSSP